MSELDNVLIGRGPERITSLFERDLNAGLLKFNLFFFKLKFLIYCDKKYFLKNI